MPRSCASATIERRITGRVPLPFARTNDWSILIMSNGKRCRRSEEHTSELQSLRHLVCRLLLEKKMHPQHGNTAAHLQIRPLRWVFGLAKGDRATQTRDQRPDRVERLGQAPSAIQRHAAPQDDT